MAEITKFSPRVLQPGSLEEQQPLQELPPVQPRPAFPVREFQQVRIIVQQQQRAQGLPPVQPRPEFPIREFQELRLFAQQQQLAQGFLLAAFAELLLRALGQDHWDINVNLENRNVNLENRNVNLEQPTSTWRGTLVKVILCGAFTLATFAIISVLFQGMSGPYGQVTKSSEDSHLMGSERAEL